MRPFPMSNPFLPLRHTKREGDTLTHVLDSLPLEGSALKKSGTCSESDVRLLSFETSIG